MKSLIFFSFLPVLLILFIPTAYAEGGGGIDCPETSGVYTYVTGSTSYDEIAFEQGQLGVVYCEYETESEEEDIEPFGEIYAVFHITGELSQELIDEYGCGSILGEQFSPTYVSSTNNFASVAFSTVQLLEGAADIMTQIEEQNLATVCTSDTNGGSTAENVKEAVEEHEIIEDTSIEVSNEEIDEETIEDIMEEIAEETKKEKTITQLDPAILLPNWIKDNAAWWSTDQITDDDFSNGIEYMINKGIIKVPSTEATSDASSDIPDWVKDNAGWWSEGLISDSDFVNGLQYLISNGIISVV